jgi:acetyl esterase/lipase
VGDYLSYQQDAVATEAYIETARSRISLRRHALLVDYTIHDGCNARTWMHLEVNAQAFLDQKLTRFYTFAPGMPSSLAVGTVNEEVAIKVGVVVFQPMQNAVLYPEHNQMNFYTWGDTNCCLPRGATEATLLGSFPNLQPGDVLLFEEVLGPQTGNVADADIRHRHAVRLTQVTTQNSQGQPLVDPLIATGSGDPIISASQTPTPVTEIQWSSEDALPFPLCLSSTFLDATGKAQTLTNVSIVLGNNVLADQGLTLSAVSLGTVPEPSIFLPPDATQDRCTPSRPTPLPVRYNPVVPDSPLAQAVALPLAGSPVTLGIGASFTKDFGEVAYTAAMPNTGAEVYIASTAGSGAPVRVTHLMDAMNTYTLARREVVSWKSGDGATVEGILEKPADFDAKKKYPLLVVIHGGPTGVDRPNVSADRYYPVELFVAKGALVLRPNYRGSAGYGAKFRALNVRNLGVGDYADVISGVDYLIARGFVDKDRVGSMGWSEGGYISAFITTSSDRFKAVSVGAGISDWMTYYVNTDITPFTRQYLKATPWDDPEVYKKTSPISYIAKAKTPTLIQQGDRDKRVPVPDSFELRQALEDKGVPVKMVLYHGFGHPIDKPKQQRAVMEENLHWFEHYIWGEPFAAGVGPGAAPVATK